MPGHYIHLAAADRVAALLESLEDWRQRLGEVPDTSGPDPVSLARLALEHHNFYALGAIGPDLFFFLPDFRNQPGLANSLIGVLHFLDELYEKLDEWLLGPMDRYFGPGSQNTEETISRLTGDLSTLVQDILGSLTSLLTNALMTLAAQSIDWWGKFSLGLDRGYDNKSFLWSDMLHYRKTSQFGRALWELAGEADGSEMADKLRAYALGYITHLGTDVTGHAFVNAKAGGPFRTHWQRHHLVENHMDARCYDDDHGADSTYNMLTEAGLHYRILFGADESKTLPPFPPGDNTLRGKYVRRRQLVADSELPDEVAQLLFDAMSRAYQTSGGASGSVDNPLEATPKIIKGGDGRPPVETIQDTFLLLFRYLKYVTLDGFSNEKPAPPVLFPNLDFPQLTDPHDSAPGAADPPADFWNIVLAIIRFLLFVKDAAVWFATVLPGLAADLGTFYPRLAAYYTVELPLYYMLKAQRAILVMSGYLLPMKDEIDLGLIQLCTGSRDLFLTQLGGADDVFGGLGEEIELAGVLTRVDALMTDQHLSRESAVAQALAERGIAQRPPPEPLPDPAFPHSIKTDDLGHPTEFHAPWAYPDSPVEQTPTVAGPYSRGDTPDVLLRGTAIGNPQVRAAFESAQTPADTDRVALDVGPDRNMGDSVNFATYLIWQLTRDTGEPGTITDWNLDADRGYGYKCWDWDRCIEQVRHQHDEIGNEFLGTKSEPPQTAGTDDFLNPVVNPKYSPSQPLLIHYLGSQEETPGPTPCDPGPIDLVRGAPGPAPGKGGGEEPNR